MKAKGWVVIYCLVINVILAIFLNKFSKDLDVYLKLAFIDMGLMVISWSVAFIICFTSFLSGNNIFVKEEELI